MKLWTHVNAKRDRNLEIIRRLNKGESISSVAEHFNICTMRVRGIRGYYDYYYKLYNGNVT